MKYPKGFPKEGVTDYKGKELITHEGLVWLATHRGPWSSTVDHVERVFGEDGLPIYIEATVTVSAPRTTEAIAIGEFVVSHTAIGDATRDNCGSMVANALPRMAHTRALSRALRASLGIGRTTAEEMGPDAPERAQVPPKRQHSEQQRTAPDAPPLKRDDSSLLDDDWQKGDTVATANGNVGTIFWIGGDKGDRVGVRWGDSDDEKEWTYTRFLSDPKHSDGPQEPEYIEPSPEITSAHGSDTDVPF